MIDKLFRWPRACAQVLSSPAGPYLDDLATILVRQGFGRWKVRQRLHGAAHFSLFSAMVGVSLEGLHEDLFPAFRAHLRRCRCPGRLRRGRSADVCTVAGARALVEHLRHIAVVQRPSPYQRRPTCRPWCNVFTPGCSSSEGFRTPRCGTMSA
jgi:hypothetical protein